MRFDDVEKELKGRTRASLDPERKAMLRAQLVATIQGERQSRTEGRQHRKNTRSAVLATASAAILFVVAGYGTYALRSQHPANTTSPAARGNTTSITHVKTSPVSLSVLHMANPKVGWAISRAGGILRTVDGGQTWTDVTPSLKQPLHVQRMATTGEWEAPVAFIDGMNAVVAGNAPTTSGGITAYITRDGGYSWSTVMVPTPEPGFQVASVQFIDARNGWVVERKITGSNPLMAIVRTADEGRTWNQVAIYDDHHAPNGNSFFTDESMVRFATPETAWAILGSKTGGSFAFARTTAHGDWQFMTTPDLPTPPEVRNAQPVFDYLPTFFGANGVWPVQYDVLNSTSRKSYVVVYTTTDAGITWHASKPHATQAATPEYNFMSPKVGWAYITPTQLERTTDGGETWEPIYPTRHLDGILEWYFWEPNVGVALVNSGQNGGTELIQTEDGGRTWKTVQTQLAAPEG